MYARRIRGQRGWWSGDAIAAAPTLVAQDLPAQALVPLERALVLREANPGSPEALADTRFNLARALRDSHGDRQRAAKLARAALEGYREVGDREAAAAGRVSIWLEDEGER